MGEPGGEGKGEKMNRMRKRKSDKEKNEKAKGGKKRRGELHKKKKKKKGEKKMREEEERYWIPIRASNWIRSTSNLDILFYLTPETSSWFPIKISTVRFSYIESHFRRFENRF